MDRNVVIATILIVLILFVWMYFLSPPPPPVQDPAAVDIDTTEAVVPLDEPEPQALTAPQAAPVTVADSTIAEAQEGEERLITVDTDLYRAQFSTKGGTPVSFELKAFQQYDQQTPVQLIDSMAHGALGLVFTTPASHVIDTRTLFFEPDIEGDVLQVTDEPATLTFEKTLGEGRIQLAYTFTPGNYEVDLSVVQENASAYQTEEGYEMVWNGAVPFSEDPHNRKEEATKLGAYARSGGEVEGITLASEIDEELTLRGDVTWIAVKNKYFTVVVIPPANAPREAELIGERTGEIDDPAVQSVFRASLFMPQPDGQGDDFRIYMGPLEYRKIARYDLGIYDMVDYGWDFFEWMTRPLGKYVFIPAFTLLSGLIGNYGLVIVIFALLIKLVLYPLTKSSYKSMARMRELQPAMQEIKEKYPDDPAKQQEATMKLYRKSGVNPLGGCLPMFLQYPIIISLWMFLQQAIEIRQEGFLWASDLSAPDAILNLPFTIPLYGDFVAGFTLLMGLSMILQMRVQSAPSSGPQAKVFMYLMPGVIFVIFNSLPSGVSLYYLCYNVITAVQQKWINKSLEAEKEEEEGGSKKSSSLSKNGRQKKGASKKKGGRQVRTG